MSLLLLPALAPPVKRSTWWTAYRATIEDVLKRLQPANEHEVVRLDIALFFTSSFTSTTQRTAFYPLFQDTLRELYSLICIGATRVKVELDFPGGIDARVIFLDSRQSDTLSPFIGKQQFSGPIVDLHTFVASQRPYRTIYSVESESGESALQSLLQLWRVNGSVPEIERLPCGTSIITSAQDTSTHAELRSSSNHKRIANGGTWDHLHIGHKLLLAATVFIPEPDYSDQPSSRRIMNICITGDDLLVNKKHGALVETWEERQQRTAEFVESILVFHSDVSAVRAIERIDQPGPNGKSVKVTYGKELQINYTQITDPFGPTITDETISALIVSAETRAGGKAINEKRTAKGWKPLEVFEVDVLDANVQDDFKGTAAEGQSFENKISSTEIRRRLEAKARTSSGHL